MKSIWLAATLAVIALACVGSAVAAEHTKDCLEKVRKNLSKDKAVLIDVREEQEWDAGHLEAARHVPLTWLAKSPDPKEVEKKFPKEKIIYLHCKSGGRCLIAADLLKDAGYDLRPLKGGYEDLRKAGFKKADNEKKRD